MNNESIAATGVNLATTRHSLLVTDHTQGWNTFGLLPGSTLSTYLFLKLFVVILIFFAYVIKCPE